MQYKQFPQEQIIVARLSPGEDLKKSILKIIEETKLKAGIIQTCIGSLKQVHIRLADERYNLKKQELFEIVSLVGTLSQDGVHLHIAVDDKNGNTIGGHLKNENIINTTAEIVVQHWNGIKFKREFDEITGFKELSF